jgi:mannosyl-3-phosphoglycerate phosphatase
MEKIIAWYKHEYKQVFSIVLGDSPNDFSMLELADFPVLIRSQREFPDLKREIPRLRVTREIGPKGWNKAILDILGKKEEARNV